MNARMVPAIQTASKVRTYPEARIIATADAVEAMASDQPYRQALSYKKIEEELKRNSGTHFDPMIIETMLQILHKRNEHPQVNFTEKLAFEPYGYAYAKPLAQPAARDKFSYKLQEQSIVWFEV